MSYDFSWQVLNLESLYLLSFNMLVFVVNEFQMKVELYMI